MEDDALVDVLAVIIDIALAVYAADETTILLLRMGETANARTVVDVNRVARQSIQINVEML